MWREPVPFNLSSEYGLAIAHYGNYCLLSSPKRVWRAPLASQSLELTDDALSLKQETKSSGGKLAVELINDDGGFSSLPSPLDIGCQLDLSPDYNTAQGNEASPGQSFILETYEHASSGGRASLVLYALDVWSLVVNWHTRYQMRWNKDSSDASVKDILAFVLARAGLKLEVVSQSSVITGYYPDFTTNPGTGGMAVVNRLLSLVPDVLFIEGNKVYLVNPLASDISVYSYGSDHPILQGRYRLSALQHNRIQIEGYDNGAIIADSFDWDEVDKVYDRLRRVEDNNINTVAGVQARGEACLREAEIASADGSILIPVNCGHQLYDVVDITDSRAGLDVQKKRLVR